MTKIPSMRLSLLALVALGLPVPSMAKPEEIGGQTYLLEKNKKNYVDFLSEKSVAALMTRLVSPCPAPPPLAATGIVPTQNPNALPNAFFPTATVTNSLVPPPQTVGVTFVAGDQSINPSWVISPPDTMGCIGPEQFVVAINPGIISFTKGGVRDNVLDVEPGSFLNLDGDFNTIANMADPRIYFDRQSNRWYYIVKNLDSNGSGQNNGFSIWVSDSGILSDTSNFTVLNIYNATLVPDENGCPGDQNLKFDFASLGMDVNALYTSFNMFDVNNNYLTTTAFVIQKSSLLTDGPVFVTVFRDVVGDVGDEKPFRFASSVLTPAINFDPNPQFGYYLATDPFEFGKLNLYRVINSGSKTPTLTTAIDINVLTTSSTTLPNMPFIGNLFSVLGTLEVQDDRIMTPVIRNGQLYAIQTILVDNTGIADTNFNDPNARAAARWYQFDLGTVSGTETATSVPTLIQAGTLFDTVTLNPLWYNMPSLMINSRADMVIGFTVSSNTKQPSAGFVGRLASDPLGTLRIGSPPPNIYAAGNNAQFSRLLGLGNPFTGFGQRWGEYSYTSLDPADDLTMWTIQERTQNSLEQVVVAQLIAP